MRRNPTNYVCDPRYPHLRPCGPLKPAMRAVVEAYGEVACACGCTPYDWCQEATLDGPMQRPQRRQNRTRPKGEVPFQQ